MSGLSERSRFGIGLAVSITGIAGFAVGLLWDLLSGRELRAGSMGPLQLAAAAAGVVMCIIGVAILLIPVRAVQSTGEGPGGAVEEE